MDVIDALGGQWKRMVSSCSAQMLAWVNGRAKSRVTHFWHGFIPTFGDSFSCLCVCTHQVPCAARCNKIQHNIPSRRRRYDIT
eukprot:1933604-Amphidinium_carterae.1